MNIIFRVDSSRELGSGHVSRCMTLACELKNHGANVSFVCRELDGHLNGFIEVSGFKLFCLKSGGISLNFEIDAKETLNILSQNKLDCDWLIVDHYALGSEWESKLKSVVKHIMVIDDLANRAHDCDILLDQNYYINAAMRYDGLVPTQAMKLLGPEFAMLRSEFAHTKVSLRTRLNKITRLLIFFGGSDLANETAKTLEALEHINKKDLFVDVVLGVQNKNKDKIIKSLKWAKNYKCHLQTDKMAELMNNADLAITAGGSSTWERMCLGLPAIVISVADNQTQIAKDLFMEGFQYYLGESASVKASDIAKELERRLANPFATFMLGKKGMSLVDGQGVNRVANKIYGG